MKYIAELNDFEKALGITKEQEKRLKGAITKAYDQNWDSRGANIDQINAFVAQYIRTPEEAYYVAQVIMSDVWGAMMQTGKTFNAN